MAILTGSNMMTLEMCKTCGCVEENMRTLLLYNGDEVCTCNDCKDEAYRVCFVCGDFVRYDEAEDVLSYDGCNREYVCPNCLDSDVEVCSLCGERVFRGNARWHNRESYCRWCFNDNFYYCEECGEYVHVDDWDDDADMCCDCAARRDDYRIKNYHHGRKNIRFILDENGNVVYKSGMPKMTEKFIGLELEIDGGDDARSVLDSFDENLGDRVYHEHDGSLDCGFENIIQPHTYDAFFNKENMEGWRKVLEDCDKYGYSSDNDTCGMHVHLSRCIFDGYTSIAKFVYFFENFYDLMLDKFGRRGGEDRWCCRYSSKGEWRDMDRWERIDFVTEIADGTKYYDRYHAVNLTNHDTVEIRIANGTLDPTTFFATVDFCYKLAEAANKIEWNDVSDILNWFGACDAFRPETIEYLTERGLM